MEENSPAYKHFRHSVKLYKKQDLTGAIKALGQSFDLDPAAREDEKAQRLAVKLTGLPLEQAVEAMADFDIRRKLVSHHRQPETPAASEVPVIVWVGAGLVALIVVAISGFYVFNTTIVPQIMANNPYLAAGQVERRTLGGSPAQEYYVALPIGEPPETGWPTLIAVHGPGQTGMDMVNLFKEQTQSNGILLVAPTFADMQATEDYYDAARNTLMLILDEMQMAAYEQPAATMHFIGNVYFGYSVGATIVSWIAGRGLDYADAGFAVDTPLAVSLANGGPGFYLPLNPMLPCLVTVGENDPLAYLSTDYAAGMQAQGYSVSLQLIPGAGEALTPQQVEATITLVMQVYSL